MNDETNQSTPFGGEGAGGTTTTTTTTTRKYRSIFNDGSRKYMTGTEAQKLVVEGNEILTEDLIIEDKEEKKKHTTTTEGAVEGETTATTTVSSSNDDDIVNEPLSHSSLLENNKSLFGTSSFPVKKQRLGLLELLLAVLLVVTVATTITFWSLISVGEYSLPSTTTIGTTDIHHYSNMKSSFQSVLERYIQMGYASLPLWIIQQLPSQLHQILQQQHENTVPFLTMGAGNI